MKPWQKLAIISACGGAAFALVIALVTGGYFWYASRPKPPEPWNTTAIKGRFEAIRTEGSNNTIEFCYTLQNTTEDDYQVENQSELSLASRLADSKSLFFEPGEEHALTFDFPLYIPSRQRLNFNIHLAYPYPGTVPSPEAGKEEWREYRKALKAYASKEYSNLNGFVLFDKAHRYEIDLPKGW